MARGSILGTDPGPPPDTSHNAMPSDTPPPRSPLHPNACARPGGCQGLGLGMGTNPPAQAEAVGPRGHAAALVVGFPCDGPTSDGSQVSFDLRVCAAVRPLERAVLLW